MFIKLAFIVNLIIEDKVCRHWSKTETFYFIAWINVWIFKQLVHNDIIRNWWRNALCITVENIQ